MSMQYELEVFDQSSPFSQGTLRRCFSVAYLDQKRIVVDCAIETTPMIFENVFVVINLKEIVFREYLTNVNIGQQNNIMKRKIGIVNHSQKDADDDDKTLIRAHLEVDGDH
jgi:hypothetical protein